MQLFNEVEKFSVLGHGSRESLVTQTLVHESLLKKTLHYYKFLAVIELTTITAVSVACRIL